MAEVFLARTVGAAGFSRQVAVKRVLPGYANNPAFTEMFVSEAQLTSRLQHPNVVSVMDFDHDQEGGLFLVMELVDGVDLDGLQATGFLPLPVVLFVIAEVLRGLGHAHELPVSNDDVRGLVHRDVSPHNVLLSWEGAVKVSDFGIAKARAASVATASALIKGKPPYMSPEQANGERLDGRSDLFAVGVVLWELLCGRPLFAGDTTQSTLARVLFAPIVSPREMRPDVPVDVERVAMRLLQRARGDRYARGDQAVADLTACADYPRDGRVLLTHLLADRFPGRAPPRADLIKPAGPYDVTRGPTSDAPVVSARALPSASEGGPSRSTVGSPAPRRGRAPLAFALAAAAALAVTVGLYLRRDLGATTTERSVAPVAPTHAPVDPTQTGAAPTAADTATVSAGSGDAPSAMPLDAAPRDADRERVDLGLAQPDAGAPPDRAPPPRTAPTRRRTPQTAPKSDGIREVQLGE